MELKRMTNTETVTSPFGVFTGMENERVITQIKKYGAHTRPELSMVLSFLEEGDNVIDVGAHIGTFAVPMKKKIGPEGQIYVFEANPETFQLLEINFQNNGLEAVKFNKGVSEKSGTLFIQERNEKDSGCDYLIDGDDEQTQNLVQVELVEIDKVIKNPVDFIKVDVEGMEISVLASASNIIKKYRPIIYTEYVYFYIKRSGDDPARFRKFFKDRDYHFFINTGPRHAENDQFNLVRVPCPLYVRGQVDFMMIPAESPRYPKQYQNWYQHNFIHFILNRTKNLLRDVKNSLKTICRLSEK